MSIPLSPYCFLFFLFLKASSSRVQEWMSSVPLFVDKEGVSPPAVGHNVLPHPGGEVSVALSEDGDLDDSDEFCFAGLAEESKRIQGEKSLHAVFLSSNSQNCNINKVDNPYSQYCSPCNARTESPHAAPSSSAAKSHSGYCGHQGDQGQ